MSETKRLTDGLGADLIIDGVGKTTFAGNLEAAAIRGHVVIHGCANGLPDPIQPVSLIWRAISISGGMLAHFTRTREELLRRADDVLKGFARAGSDCTLIECFRWRKRWKRNEDWKTANPQARSSCRQRHNPAAPSDGRYENFQRTQNLQLRGRGGTCESATSCKAPTQRSYNHATATTVNSR